ncbi:MAG: hypothetical protein HY912_06890 [Desulfomonile tiedjei]|uniref:Phosphodiester glycosidase domain-containing protein n=1 Tax=Desulfomonile tiedjei TaxID=2358 RepID=A0A9D6UZL4_9BACT|nr:hypothetical protein [Desulfomonile tiedjei]
MISLALCAHSALADSFDEFPPVWDPLLWGGKPGIESDTRSDLSAPTGQEANAYLTGWQPQEPRGANRNSSHGDDVPVGTPQKPANGRFQPQYSDARNSTVLVTTADQSVPPYIAPFRKLTLKNIPPLYVTPPLPGEGVWSSQNMPSTPDGQPIIYRTSYRPSVEYANAIVHMLLFDMKRLNMRLYIGSGEPWAGTASSSIEPDLKSQLVAVTNALWKQKHSGEGGAVFRGKVLKPLTPGVATIVVYNDDSVDVLEWNDGIPLSMVRDARQLRHLIVKDGKVVDSVVKGGKKADSEIGLGFLLSENEQGSGEQYWWGGYGAAPAPTYGPDWFIATRSAFGIRGDGNMVFAIGHHISTKDLAKALVLAGCERGIHGDANPHNVVGNLYYTNPDGTISKRARLSPDQKTYTLERYDRSYTSDFFAIFLKSASGES